MIFVIFKIVSKIKNLNLFYFFSLFKLKLFLKFLTTANDFLRGQSLLESSVEFLIHNKYLWRTKPYLSSITKFHNYNASVFQVTVTGCPSPGSTPNISMATSSCCRRKATELTLWYIWRFVSSLCYQNSMFHKLNLSSVYLMRQTNFCRSSTRRAPDFTKQLCRPVTGRIR